MTKIHRFFILSGFLLFSSFLFSQQIAAQKPYLILVSFDGFRHDYPSLTNTPNFKFIETNGFKAEALKPAFPSQTFPNHYSMVTGLYPEHHGIVGNTFFAPDINKSFKVGSVDASENPDFYLGEPIWKTVMRYNKKSAVYFWVGSEAIKPNYFYKYDSKVPYDARIEQLNRWLELPYSERPNLICLYFEEVDWQGHDYGAKSTEVLQAVRVADALLGRIITTIHESDLADSINLVVASDHGMIDMIPENAIDIEPILKKLPANATVSPYYSTTSVYIPGISVDSLIAEFPNIPHLSVYNTKKAPLTLHINETNRLGDIILIPEPGYKLKRGEKPYSLSKAGHGFDPENSDMWGIFYAYGPSVKRNTKGPVADVVDVYPFCLSLLGLSIDHKTDGTAEHLKSALKK